MDVTRTIAIILVLFIHSWDGVILSHHHIDNDLKQWVIYQAGHIIGRVGVPLFYFLSGSLVLTSIYDKDIIQFYKDKIPRFLYLTFVYFLVTNIFHLYLYRNDIHVYALIESLLYGNTLAAYQLWFMFSIIGLYLIAPFMSRMVKQLKDKELIILISLSLMLVNMPNLFYVLFGKNIFLSNIGWDFIGGDITYFLLGYLVYARGFLQSTSKAMLILFASSFFFSLLLIQYYLKVTGKMQGEGFTWYNSILIIMISFFIFTLLRQVKSPSDTSLMRKSMEYCSRSSFSVFLFHLIPMTLLFKVFDKINLEEHLKVLLISTMTYLLSLAYYRIISNSKVLKKILL
ncbi:acyltransferase [Martelella alba]|uniref:Acyltransferase n=1 Tax=Martelella alba TaxID=2590451 RepID=A0ABY2SJC0_9HYPH|nr:acyltransferase [Martelella alba]TKI05533.1 acyltransferase [Martelella alba]